MKIMKVAKLCKNRCIIRIVNRIMGGEHQQLIGDGTALYFTGAHPKMEENSVLAAMDIPEEKRKLFDIDEDFDTSLGISLLDNLRDDRMIHREELITLGAEGDSYIILYTSQGVRLLNAAYLDPIGDCHEVTLWERSDNRGRMRVVVKSGVFLVAIMEPTKVPDAVVDTLETILQVIHRYGVDPDTGEVMEAEDGRLADV